MNEMRRLARRLAFLVIYAIDMSKAPVDDVLSYYFNADQIGTLIADASFFDSEDKTKKWATAFQQVLTADIVQEENVQSSEKASQPSEEMINEALTYIRETVIGTWRHLDAIDAVIDRYAKRWRAERMHSTDRNLLRLAVYEIQYALRPKDAPLIINEAVELTKIYGEDESYKFINAVLDAIEKNEVAQ